MRVKLPRPPCRRFGFWLAIALLGQCSIASFAAPVSNPIEPVPKPEFIPPERSLATLRGPAFFTIATGSPAGTYFAVGEALAAVISHPAGSERCSEIIEKCGPEGMLAIAQTSDGSVTNINAVNTGAVASGLAQADLVDTALKGEAPFDGQEPLTKLRAIGSLYSESLHVIAAARAGISSIADLRNKRVSIDRAGSGHRSVALRVLRAYGLSNDEIIVLETNTLESIDLIRTDRLDAFFFVGGAPVPGLRELLTSGQQSLVSLEAEKIDFIRSAAPLLREARISAGMYPTDSDVSTISVEAVWLVNADISDQRIYAVTRALWYEDNRETLVAGHEQGQFITLQSVLTDLPVPLHPGAEAYYREIGLIEKQGD